jgi:hypothetical protein
MLPPAWNTPGHSSAPRQEANDGFDHAIDLVVPFCISSSPSPSPEVTGTIAIVDNRVADRRR